MRPGRWLLAWLLWAAFLATPLPAQETAPATARQPGETRIVLWNVRNFGVSDHFVAGQRREGIMKPASEVQAMVAILKELDPDILAVNEVISAPDGRYVKALQALLKRAGLDYPHLATCRGSDDRIQNVLLSRLPLSDVRNLGGKPFTLQRHSASTGKSMPVEMTPLRGFLHATAKLPDGTELGLVVAHLKSKAREPEFRGKDPDIPGQEAIRLEEMQLLTQAIDPLIRRHPDRPLVLLGDLNDTPGSRTMAWMHDWSAILRGGKATMLDLALTDYHGDRWTHFYYPEKAYNVLDYIFVTPNLKPRLREPGCFIYREPANAPTPLQTATASDHRPLVITLATEE